MRILDLFCGGGLAADGYVAAGHEVTGVDITDQPHYPYKFIQADAIEFLQSVRPSAYDAIHASPPCQLFTQAKHLREAQGGQSSSGDFLRPTLDLLHDEWNHKVWIVENVERAKVLMPSPVRLCGSSFGLQVQRHRMFSSNVDIYGTECDHSRFPRDPQTGKPRPWGVYHRPGDNIPGGGRTASNAKHGQQVMGVDRDIPWDTLKEGFPPAYTEHIGAQLWRL